MGGTTPEEMWSDSNEEQTQQYISNPGLLPGLAYSITSIKDIQS